MNPVHETVQLVAAVANGLCTTQTGTGGTALTLNGSLVSGGVGTLDSGGAARRVIITSAGNDSGITFKIVGINFFGNPITDTVTGANVGAAVSNLDFLTVSSITPSGNTAGNVTAGTNATGSGAWHFPSRELTPFALSLALSIPSGTTASIEHTYDDPNVYTMPGYGYGSVEPNSSTPPVVWINPDFNALTNVNAEGNFDKPVFAFRTTITAGTGKVTLWANQTGIAG